MAQKFVIGIDLGTTNSVLAFVPAGEELARVEVLPLPQLVAPGVVEPRLSLPSFLYVAAPGEAESGNYDLPWRSGASIVVGELARKNAADVPQRTIGAAKSWLCHSRVDRRQPILPWNAPDDVTKLSPVEASQRYLEHLVACWNAAHPEAPFSAQQVVLTVPASFDAAARELTREAALAAGFPESFVLLEEPQAAVYAWLASAGDGWRKKVAAGDTLLVCDVGGGTTDLTLVSIAEEEGELLLRRLAVGNHLLVGGDNMDLALAHYVAARFAEKGTQLDPWQSVSLWHSCRQAKEALLSSQGAKKHVVSVLGRGSRLIGGTVKVEVDRDEVATLLLDGFLPDCPANAKPQRQRSSGFHEIGLPYEADAAITKHLASFLASNRTDGKDVRVSHVLLNGGVFKSDALRNRLCDVLSKWSAGEKPRMLDAAADLDHSVAKGAAYYGWTKINGGVRIRGGTARSYYVGVESAGLAIPGAPRPLRAVCVVPFGMEEGTHADVPTGDIGLVVGEAAQFRFFSSATRKQDQVGDQLSAWTADDLSETDSLETTLTAANDTGDDYVSVRFQSHITELGVLELWCVSVIDDQRWKLEFSVRDHDA